MSTNETTDPGGRIVVEQAVRIDAGTFLPVSSTFKLSHMPPNATDYATQSVYADFGRRVSIAIPSDAAKG